jgi:hypothetical protein
MADLQRRFAGDGLPVFVVLVYPLSWWAVPYLQGGLIAQGPMLAAIVAVALASGRAGLSAYWRSLLHWRAGWWYLIGPALIVSYLALAFAANLLLGAHLAHAPQLPSVAVVLQLLLLGGLWEEPGWTGYALPRLQARFARYRLGALWAALSVAVLRSLWHLPLLVYGKLVWFDVLFFSLAMQLLIAWIYNASRGSVPAVMVFHFTTNLLAGGTMLLVFEGADRLAYWALFTASASVLALVLLWRTRLTLGARTPPDSTAVRVPG